VRNIPLSAEDFQDFAEIMLDTEIRRLTARPKTGEEEAEEGPANR